MSPPPDPVTVPSFLPPRPFGTALLRRTALVWFMLHFAAGSTRALQAGATPDALRPSILTVSWVAGATMVVVWFEMWRHGELVFLANLGYEPAKLCAVVGILSVALDLVLGLSLG